MNAPGPVTLIRRSDWRKCGKKNILWCDTVQWLSRASQRVPKKWRSPPSVVFVTCRWKFLVRSLARCPVLWKVWEVSLLLQANFKRKCRDTNQCILNLEQSSQAWRSSKALHGNARENAVGQGQMKWHEHTWGPHELLIFFLFVFEVDGGAKRAHADGMEQVDLQRSWPHSFSMFQNVFGAEEVSYGQLMTFFVVLRHSSTLLRTRQSPKHTLIWTRCGRAEFHDTAARVLPRHKMNIQKCLKFEHPNFKKFRFAWWPGWSSILEQGTWSEAKKGGQRWQLSTKVVPFPKALANSFLARTWLLAALWGLVFLHVNISQSDRCFCWVSRKRISCARCEQNILIGEGHRQISLRSMALQCPRSSSAVAIWTRLAGTLNHNVTSWFSWSMANLYFLLWIANDC